MRNSTLNKYAQILESNLYPMAPLKEAMKTDSSLTSANVIETETIQRHLFAVRDRLIKRLLTGKLDSELSAIILMDALAYNNMVNDIVYNFVFICFVCV